jgi:uncharacterized membrane protein YdjX (TVP38/TMEM64 family)
MVPVMALVVATVVVFGPILGVAYALVGAVASAAIAYGVGRALWRDALQRMAGPSFERLRRRFGRHGILAVAAVRLLPIAPFTIVNLVAGALRVRFDHFIVGTLLGMAPGAAGFGALLRVFGG